MKQEDNTHIDTDQNNMETEIDVSGKIFQAVFQAASDGILLADIGNKNFIDANDAICEMLGYSHDELLKLSVSDIHPQKDLPRINDAFEKQVKGEIVVALELPVQRKNGSVFYADISSRLLSLDEQKILIGIFRDATHRIETEHLLKAEEHKAQQYLDIAGVMLGVLNKEGAITLINQKGCEILNVTEDETLGKNWFDNYLPKRMVDEVKEVFHQLMKGDIEPVEYYENAVLTSKGQESIIAFHNTVIKDEKGNIQGVLFSGDDITDHKVALENILAQESFFQDAIDAQTDTFFIFDPATGKALQWNKAFEKVSGYTKEEIASLKAPESYYSEEDLEKAGKYIEKILSGGAGTVELNLICKSGKLIPTEYSASVIRNVAGEPEKIIAIGRDITNRKKEEKEKAELEKQVQRAQKLESIGVLAGGIAHDFNNILSAILGNINLVRHVISPSESEIHTFLEEAEKASIRAQNLTHQLLTFSKGGEPIRKATSITEIIKESATFVLRGTNIEYVHDIQKDILPVDVDQGQISQVVQNIVLNARHAMPAGGTLKIKCSNISPESNKTLFLEENKKYVQVDIADNGIGIPSNIIDNIFDPYFSTKTEGNGLGLAICYSIMNKHHGDISVKSEPGKGSVFTLYLPASDKALTEKEPEHHEGLFSGMEPSVLIMDDNEQIINTTNSLLSHLGCTTLLAYDGEEAVNLYKSSLQEGKPIDIIIMDLTIPGGMGGKEAVIEILKLNPEAKVVVSSGYSNDPVMAEYQKYGFCASIIKPYMLKDLSKTINEVLKSL